jgi:hypothetical protein
MFKILMSLFAPVKLGVLPDAPINETEEQKKARMDRENAIRHEALVNARTEAEATIRRGLTMGDRANRVTESMLGHSGGENFVESTKITLKELGGFALQAGLWSVGAAAVGFAAAFGYKKGQQFADPNQGGGEGANEGGGGMSRSEAGARGGRASAGGR